MNIKFHPLKIRLDPPLRNTITLCTCVHLCVRVRVCACVCQLRINGRYTMSGRCSQGRGCGRAPHTLGTANGAVVIQGKKKNTPTPADIHQPRRCHHTLLFQHSLITWSASFSLCLHLLSVFVLSVQLLQSFSDFLLYDSICFQGLSLISLFPLMALSELPSHDTILFLHASSPQWPDLYRAIVREYRNDTGHMEFERRGRQLDGRMGGWGERGRQDKVKVKSGCGLKWQRRRQVTEMKRKNEVGFE